MMSLRIKSFSNLNLVTWNIKTVQEKPNTNKPERKSAIVSKELEKYTTDVVAFSEKRFAEDGRIKEETGYTFYSSGKTLTDRSESGVAFRIRNGLSSISEDPKSSSEKFITLRFPLLNSRYCTLITTYEPTMTK